MWYDLDYMKFVIGLLPPAIRRPRMLSLAKVLAVPFREQMTDNKSFYNTRLNKLGVNGRVIYMEHELNALYYTDKIYITDNPHRMNVSVYADSEIPLYLADTVNDDAVCLYGDLSDAGADFIVNVPQSLAGDIIDLENSVNYYRPAGRTFRIEIYNDNEEVTIRRT